MKSLELLNVGKAKLINIPSGKTDAMELLMISASKSKLELLKNVEIEKSVEKEYFANLEKRLNGEPMQKFYGYTEFLGVKISFNEQTLTPRQETEILADLIIKDIGKLGDKVSVLDLCAGSGCIGLAIKKHTNSIVTLSDISDFAIAHINENAKNNNLNVCVIKSNMFNLLEGQFDIIVSNPPYLKTCELQTLEKEVDLFDPKLALDGGEDGLDFYRVIANNLIDFLKPNGNLYLEIHYMLGNETKKLFEKYFENVKIIKDFGGQDRFVVCYNRKEII